MKYLLIVFYEFIRSPEYLKQKSAPELPLLTERKLSRDESKPIREAPPIPENANIHDTATTETANNR